MIEVDPGAGSVWSKRGRWVMTFMTLDSFQENREEDFQLSE